MRLSFAAGLACAILCCGVAADPASFPIMPDVQYSANGATAHVSVTVYDDASAIDVEVYGLDGMRAGDDNRVHMHRDALAKGASFAFDVAVHPGPGLSSLAVMAKAKFAHAGSGNTMRSFPYGKESAAQQQEHSRCVRKDPQGEWIRLPDCDDPAPVDAPPVLTVAQLKASPPVGKIVRITGYVTDTYLCPPCPDGAMCKPCMSESSVFIADTPGGSPTVAIGVAAPAEYERGKQYRFEITVTARTPEGVDGRMLRSQGAGEPAWKAPK